MNAPIGFRFNPTDEELIEILRSKVSGNQMLFHSYFIVERNVYEQAPEDLEWVHSLEVHNNITERYYYCIREDDSREVSGQGWWKATGHVKKIYANNKCVVGYKRPLTFHKFIDNERNRKKGIKTDWIMHEYGLESYPTLLKWRLCKIKHKGKQSVQVQEELESTRKCYGLSNDFEGSCSIMSMQSTIADEEQPQPQFVDQDFDQNMQTEVVDEQNLLLFSSYDPILTHFPSTTNDYFGDHELEQPYSTNESFPSLWSW